MQEDNSIHPLPTQEIQHAQPAQVSQEAHKEETGPTFDADIKFHDPSWVRWWLCTLYQFPAAEQYSIALALNERITKPDVNKVVVDFLDKLVITYSPASESDESSGDGEPNEVWKVRMVKSANYVWKRHRMAIVFMGCLAALTVGNWLSRLFP
jgi:hypothetical protein